MRAVVGGVFAAGEPDAFADWALGLSQRDVLRLVDVKLAGSGMMRAERVLERVREIVGDQRIEQLPILFTAVATDLLAHREVWLQRGPLDGAIRASIALPGVFTPVMLNGRLLADGLTEPVSVAPPLTIAADLTIAIALSGGRGVRGPAVHVSAEPGRLDH